MITIAFTGGGTGGHIYPGLAVAAYLQKQVSCRIFWIGSSTGMDKAIVEEGGLPFFGIPSGKLRRYFSLRNCADILMVGAGFFAALGILKREKPDLLFSKGGFVSVPPCAAAWLLHIPVFTHESDYSPGLATRINARFARIICTGFGETAGFFPEKLRSRVRATGNPVRPEFRAADPAKGRAFLGIGPAEPILLVLGGSLGARQLNELVRDSLGELTQHFTVVHQTGQKAEWELLKTERYRPYPYFQEEMPHVLAAADLVLCRSGAGTLWECATLGKPMILVPLSGSGTRGDQVENAGFAEKAGAALVLMGDDASPGPLLEAVTALATDPDRRAAMALASRRLGAADGAVGIADLVIAQIGSSAEQDRL
jgi:UDP-N-acetylglucosamine--N-acetylmuramyl-(pentapeptide) pyrophosphoryl-undecaprenol N-acetylglucosamine transferase